ncbi:CDF-like metal transporter [Vararia minispora EC-137]|uniref:CDF-like metal transporter n=1 Tax=Vararia minispora EC-137 TaxID=1314806 RepID=A0ACB8QI27_9AGAM|nr:CDF-like metal transporter [Vararia minispora EC-137]
MSSPKGSPKLSVDSSSKGKDFQTDRANSTPKADWSADVEGVPGASEPPRDPFQLSLRVKTDAEISELRRRRKGKDVARYHAKQNELIESLLKSMDEHTEAGRQAEEALRLPIKVAVRGSLFANFCLAVYAAAISASLSLIATGIDSLFDFGTNVLMYWIYHKARNLDVNKWPVGGNRLECIGNIDRCEYSYDGSKFHANVEAYRMGAVNLVVIVESARDLISVGTDKPFKVPALIAVGVALGIKFILFLYCFSLRNKSDQVRVLWEDHRNDLFINGFGLLMSALGSKVGWYLDPTGAILIALVVIASWCRTIYGQFALLAGRAAPHEFIQLIVYNAMTFSDDIEKVDTVRAYHSGPEYFVEVDIVMDANTPLWKAHDLSQKLQDKIEALPNVERAFVHVDHETTHTPVRALFIFPSDNIPQSVFAGT